jgi:DNA adenine methylase
MYQRSSVALAPLKVVESEPKVIPINRNQSPPEPSKPLPPFIKWAGGKRLLVPRLLEIWKDHSDRRLVDLTMGAGSIALGLRPKQALLNDVNPHLINLFKQIQQGFSLDGFEVVNTAEGYIERRDRFNDLISSDRSQTREAAQLFYYLLRHCFNGLCRLNRKGLFNVGYGKYKSLSLIQDWTEYQQALEGWQFTCGDFASVQTKSDDFIFVDPPYDSETDEQIPISIEMGANGKGFVSYTGSFGWSDQVRLAQLLADHPGPVVAFNAATPRLTELYQSLGFDVEVYDERRSISCSGDRTPARAALLTRNLNQPIVIPTGISRRTEALHQIDKIRRSGDVAPPGCWIEPYQTSKKLASGDRKTFEYFRVRSKKAIFEKDGRAIKRLHLGTASDLSYKDWVQRCDRRREINALEAECDRIEREIQKAHY